MADHKKNHTPHTPPVRSPETPTISPEAKKNNDKKNTTQQQILDTLKQNPLLDSFKQALGEQCDIVPEKRGAYDWIRIIPKGIAPETNYPIEIISVGHEVYNVRLTDYNDYNTPAIVGEKMTKDEVLGSINLCKTFLKEGKKINFPAGTKFIKHTANVEGEIQKAVEKAEKKAIPETVKETVKETTKTEEIKISPESIKETTKIEKSEEKKEVKAEKKESKEKGKSFWSKLNPKNRSIFKKKEKTGGEKKKFWDKKIGKIISAPVRIPYQIVTGTGKRVWDGVSMNVKKGWNGIKSLFTGAKNLVVDNGKWLWDGPKRAWRYVTSPFRKEKK